MTVLQLGPYPPPHGGVQTNLVAIREHLRRIFGPESAPVINLTRHRRPDADGVFYPATAAEVIRLLLTVRADVVHLHVGGQFTTRLLALCFVCSLLPGRRAVLTFHSGGYPSWQKGRRLSRWSLRGLVLRRLDAVIAVNAEIAGLFQQLGVDPDRIHTISPYAPVSVPPDLALPAHLEAFVQNHSPLLTTVGLLEPEYDLPLQINALGRIRESFPAAGLVIIGSGSLEPDLRRLIAEQPYRDHILLCGDVAHPVTIALMGRSQAFMRTTLYDGDSVSVREALQLGVPVIASDNGMRPAGVHLVPRQDLDALVRTCESVLTGIPPTESGPGHTSSDASRQARQLDEVIEIYAGLPGRPVRNARGLSSPV